MIVLAARTWMVIAALSTAILINACVAIWPYSCDAITPSRAILADLAGAGIPQWSDIVVHSWDSEFSNHCIWEWVPGAGSPSTTYEVTSNLPTTRSLPQWSRIVNNPSIVYSTTAYESVFGWPYRFKYCSESLKARYVRINALSLLVNIVLMSIGSYFIILISFVLFSICVIRQRVTP